ncbi:MAG: redoxin domain-containing protein [Bacteroidales bacterium]|nr:redoxin domain-containing protein [Bacteroidales bacterium]
MKNSKLIIAALAALALASCGRKNTTLSGLVKDAPESDIVIKSLDVNRFKLVDTVKTNPAGEFRLRLELTEPEFLYLFYGDRQIASLILRKGDNVSVKTDTLGAYSTSGSEESLRLQKVENSYNAFMRDMARILREDPSPNKAVSRRYVEYYRDRVSYVMSNAHSLTVVPVFLQKVNENLSVFDQPTDGILMNTVADSLEMTYPGSRYVKVLRKEAERRMNLMTLDSKIREANQIGYFDMELPGMEGTKIKLSDVESKITLVYFWSSTAEQMMFNISSLVPLYEQFHSKGLEIYAVALDSDKTAWATAVRNQKLPWVNVCDTRGAASPYVRSYGVSSLPMVWIIKDGTVDLASGIKDAASLQAYMKKNL